MVIEQNLDEGVQDVQKLTFYFKTVETKEDHKARANNHSRMSLIKKVMSGLSNEDQEALNKSCFGPIVKMGERLSFSSKFVHFMMLKEVVTKRTKSLWFGISDQLLRFGIDEFEHITGLMCTNIDPYNGSDYTMLDVIGHTRCTIAGLEELYEKENVDSPNKYKMALLLILEGILLGKDRAVKVGQLSINILKDVNKFNAYPWGRESYNETLKSLKKATMKDRRSGGYNLYGFPLAFQIWALESLPEVSSLFGEKDTSNVTPICLRWISRKSGSNMPQFEAIKNKGLIVISYMLGNDMKDDQTSHLGEVDDDKITEFFKRNRPTVRLLHVARKESLQAGEKRKRLKVVVSPSDSDDFVSPKPSFVKCSIKKKCPSLLPRDKTSSPNPRIIDGENNLTRSGDGEENSPMYDNRPKEICPTPIHKECVMEKKDVQQDHNEDGESRDHAEPAWAKILREQIGGISQNLLEMQKKQCEISDAVSQNILEMHKKQCEISEVVSSLAQQVGAYDNIFEDHGDDIFNILHEQRNLKVLWHRQNEQLARVDKRLHRIYKKGTLAVVETLTQCQRRMDVDVADVMQHEKEVYGESFSQQSPLVLSSDNEKIDEDKEENESPKIEDEQKAPILKQMSVQRPWKGSRLRRPTQYLKSSFTQGKNKYGEKDGKKVTISKAPKHSFLTDKQRHVFYTWYKKPSTSGDEKDNDVIECLNGGYKREWFKTILGKTDWLWDYNIEEVLCHLRKGIAEFPHHFSGVAVMYDWWTQMFSDAAYEHYLEVGPFRYEFDETMDDVYNGVQPLNYPKPLKGVQRILAALNVLNNHWVAIEIDLSSWIINVYDSDPRVTKEDVLVSKVFPIASMFAEYMRRIGLFKELDNQIYYPFQIRRVPNLPVNKESGSCGIYTVKYIEFLASGCRDMSLICDEYIPAYREQIAFDIFMRQWSWPFLQD